jgi:hypothetical protein
MADQIIWKLVPLTPTPQMLERGCAAGLSTGVLLDDTRFSCEIAVWAAMLETAPAAPPDLIPDTLLELARAECGKSIGTLAILIASKEASVASMQAGPAQDMLNDEIIVLSAMRSRHQGLLNRLQAGE